MTMEQTVKRNMLKYQVGQTIFCPSCQQVLDFKRAVSVDAMQGGELKHTAVCCAPCYDKAAEKFSAFAEKRGLTLEITDGRKL